MTTMSVEQHCHAIAIWIEEAKEDYPGLADLDIACDVVSSYIACEIGPEDDPMAKAVRRRIFGDT